MYIAPFVIGLAAQWVYPLAGLPHGPRLLLGALCVLPAIALYVAAQVTLYRARTTIDPDGRPRVLVTTGPFRRSRNPLYLALLLLYAGVALSTGAIWSLALLPVTTLWIHYGAVKREEHVLVGRFGEEYARYCQTVPRWWHLPAHRKSPR
jgi:protein-S-isoprenylcysteine O-methyltransferase Ste14